MMRPIHLRMARAALDWTVRELAMRSGVNKNTISRYEAGKEIMSGSLKELERVLIEHGIKFIDEPDRFGVYVQPPHRERPMG